MIILRFHNIGKDIIMRVVCEYHDFLSLISDGTAELQHYHYRVSWANITLSQYLESYKINVNPTG